MEEDVHLHLSTSPLSNLLCLGLCAVSKYAGDCQIIYDLSAPSDLGANDFIDPNSYSLTYCSVDDAYIIIKEQGKGVLLCKFDLPIWMFQRCLTGSFSPSHHILLC